MAKKENRENIKIIEDIFKLNKNIELSENEEEYLKDLPEKLINLLEEEGEIGKSKIKEIVLDDLLKYGYENLIDYLGLKIEDDIRNSLNSQLQDQNFLKQENTEEMKDFFNNYLKDLGLNDLIMSLKGYEKKAEGSKEVFFKKRGCKIPTQRIEALANILQAKFNETEFKSEKEDNEQAQIISFILEQVFEILLEIPNELCDTQKTIEILNLFAIKLTNSIGLSNGFRRELMDTLSKSLQSKFNQNQNPQQPVVMQ